MIAARARPPARKRWGQHFLTSPDLAERIVSAARLSPTDTVLEVGPGDGALTRAAIPRVARLLAVEIDPLRARRLAETFSAKERVRVLEGDVLARGFGEWLQAVGWQGPAVLLGNLPYNAATRILTRAIEEPLAISRVVATVQREVAERLVARPREPAYGFLSVRVAAYARARILFDLSPGAFRPRPKVTSSVVELTLRDLPAAPAERDRALAIASLGFRSRRKTLVNALAASGPRRTWEEALSAISRPPLSRAEELSLDDYRALARLVPG